MSTWVYETTVVLPEDAIEGPIDAKSLLTAWSAAELRASYKAKCHYFNSHPEMRQEEENKQAPDRYWKKEMSHFCPNRKKCEFTGHFVIEGWTAMQGSVWRQRLRVTAHDTNRTTRRRLSKQFAGIEAYMASTHGVAPTHTAQEVSP
jgi:hypothetical protein